MTAPSSLITRAQEKHNAAQAAYQTHQDNLLSLIQQMQNNIRDLQTKLQDFGQKQQDFTTKLDQTLQALEQEIGKNNGFIASLSSSNTLSKQEMVAQKRINLLQSLKQMESNLKQLDQEVTNVQNQAHQGLQQMQKDGDPVRVSLQDLLTELTSIDKELQNVESQAQAAGPATNQATPISTPGNPTKMLGTAAIDSEVLTKLGQAEIALLTLKQGLEKGRLMQQVFSNINDFGHRYNLQ